jgi:predicted RND superfamily exporter protein
MSFSDKLVRIIVDNRILIIVTMLTSLGFFGYSLSKIYIDNEPMKSVPDDLKEKIELKKLQETFPTPYILVFMGEFLEGSLIEKRDSIASWSERFESISIDSMKGITGTVHIGKIKIPAKGGFIGFKSEFIIPENNDLSEMKIIERIEENYSLTKSIISQDQSVLGIVLTINPELDRQVVVKKVAEIVDQIDSIPIVNAYLAGETAITYYLSREMNRDFMILLPLCLLVASTLLYYIYRKILYVIISLLITAIALIWTFGTMGMAGIPFSVVTSVIPIIMFPIGVANSIHVLKTYTRIRNKKKLDFFNSIAETYNELLRPIILTSITTFIGFGSFVFSDISWNRQFGLFTGIGVMLSLLFTILLMPIFLYYEKADFIEKKLLKRRPEFSEEFFIFFKKLIFNSPFCTILFTGIIIICVIGSLRVTYESNPITMFSQNSNVRKADDLITRYFGGTRFFYILLSHKEKELLHPDLWGQVDSIAKFISLDENVGDVLTIIPMLNKISMLLNNRLLSKPGVSLLLKAKEFKAYVDSWVTKDRRITKLFVICKNKSKIKYTAIADNIENHISIKYPEWDYQIAGPALLIDSILALLIKTQISSISIAVLCVFIVLVILFKSLKIGLFTIIPMVLSTLFVYALMGISNVSINTVTVIIVNTCVGIGIDYSIHFTAGFLYIKKTCSNNIEALIQTIKTKGAVIMFNTFVVGAGFFVLFFSSFPPIKHFGLFILLSMVISSLFALIFLPVCFKNYKTKQ